MSEFLTHFQSRKQAMVDLLTELINYETPTGNKAHVDKLGAFVEAQFRALGASSVTTLPQTDAGDFKLAKWNENAPGKPIMFLIHIDTVWPLGTLAERPVTIDADGRLFGPGAVDMKGGITIVLETLRGLQALNAMPDRPIWVLMTTDEEIGSIYAIPTLEQIGQQCGLVLVMEPGTKEGAIKTWRKGLATYKVHVEGRPSHAGNAPEQGINAIVELAQQVVRINGLNDLKNGTSVSVTMTEGGSAGNVIPAKASAYIDTRFLAVREMERVKAALGDLPPFVPGAKVTLEEIHARPPMEHNDLMKATVAQIKAAGERVGVTVREDGSGGGSDGNITAAMGIPTLDGLGPQGDGLHALHEHVVINSLPTRCAVMAALLQDWRDLV
ncbi:MAG TPA: M20 family metallopeptidase [Aggregatilineales bacterium]|nr:M20 family metallopeptidase [Aggregatilineales bacterium]